MSQDNSAIVMFSGGQDSTTCLAWALERFERVETVAFDYRQRHRIELDARLTVLDEVKPAFSALGGTPGRGSFHRSRGAGPDQRHVADPQRGLRHGEGRPAQHLRAGRNLLFLTFAAAIAWRRGIRHIVGGMCETDFSGYPDCRDDTVKAMQVALNLGMDRRFVLDTPLMWIDKAETWALACDLGGDALVETILEHTHTCYEAVRGARNDWGYGCGACPACVLRARGYRAWRKGEKIERPL